MMGSNPMIRRGLAASGGAAAVTLTGWFGEQTAAKSTARVAARTIDNLAPRIQLFQKNFFSTASSATVVKPIEAVAPTKSSLSFVQWYEGHLERSPILTKSVTGGILWGLGDAVAQLMPHFAFEAEGEKKELVYDWARTGRAVTFGGVIHAPTSHLHFNFLEWMTVRAGVSGLAIPVFKTIMEQFVYWSWISNSMYHGAMGAMQGMTPNQIYDRIADVLMDTQKAQWAFWIPVQLLNFKFIPVRHQLNVVLVTSIVWTALLSMWYPPVVEETPENVKPE